MWCPSAWPYLQQQGFQELDNKWGSNLQTHLVGGQLRAITCCGSEFSAELGTTFRMGFQAGSEV